MGVMKNALPFWPARKALKAHFPALRLTGPRVILRPPLPGDFADWVDVRERSRDHLTPFEPAWHPKALTAEYFAHRIGLQSRDWERGLSCSFLLFRAPDDTHPNITLIGGVNLNNICRGSAQFASLGYWLGTEHQGHGYMHEGLRLVMTYAFTAQKLHRLNAATLPHNGRSIKLLRHLGFEEEGFAKSYLEINNEWQDHILFGITEDGFKRQGPIIA